MLDLSCNLYQGYLINSILDLHISKFNGPGGVTLTCCLCSVREGFGELLVFTEEEAEGLTPRAFWSDILITWNYYLQVKSCQLHVHHTSTPDIKKHTCKH